ncbi:MAG: Tyrosine recombinase XerD, partial [Pseudomonadota bacterium]
EDEWAALWETVETLPNDTPELSRDKERLRFIIVILYFLGLRIHELATHQWNAFRKIRGAWWFFVKGKGDKLGKIPVNDALLSAISRFRRYLGLSDLPQPEEQLPLIPSWRSKEGLGVRHINQLLKKLAILTAKKFEKEPDKAEKLKKFSAHWLRHLSATMQDQAGVLFKHIQANHRHESEETTRRYVHTFDQDRHADMQKLKLPQTQG